MTCKLEWNDNRGVPINETIRDQYAKRIIEELLADPDKAMVYVATGDMLILGSIDEDGNIEIQDLEPRRWAFIEAKPLPDTNGKCICSTNTLVKSGCQCGGS